MIASLIFASMLWGDGMFFSQWTMHQHPATEFSLPLYPGVKEDRWDLAP